MKYQVKLRESVVKQLKKMDKSIAALIMGYIEKNILNCNNPRAFGKGLVENHKGKWRYRIGDYRILCEIKDEIVVVIVIAIGHRKDIY
ncbi:MAG: type II toxin-antitoxin system RelE family toxin [Fusobacteriaceae bacterium]